MASNPACIEFWFDFGSPYSYLSMMRIDALTAAAGLTLIYRPFLLGPIFKALGYDTSPFVAHPEKGRYMWRDMQRQSEKQGLPFHKPSLFPRNALLATRVAMLGENTPWIRNYCSTIMRQNFETDQDISLRSNVVSALHGLVPDANALVLAAEDESNKQRLRQQVAIAQHLGIFGAPTFFVGDEMYWGNDRLDDAIAQAKQAGRL